MLHSWDETATWNQFGCDGVQADIETRSQGSFTIVPPHSDYLLEIHDLADGQFWQVNEMPNEGWVILSNLKMDGIHHCQE